MNAMQILSLQPWVERLGWTLVHFLWQGLLIALVYAAVRRGIDRKASPSTRYVLACGALAAMMAAPLITWTLLRSSDANSSTIYPIRSTASTAFSAGIGTATIITLPAAVRDKVSKERSAPFLSWVVILWLVGAVALWVRLAGGWVVALRMRSMLVRHAPPEWQEILRKLGLRIDLSRPVKLLVSAMVQVPTVVGWLRPVVLVPVGALSGLPPEHMEALLLHELAHIRRHDYLVNILQSVAEALLFYHPAVWWVSEHIRAERELCCDDVAVSVSGDALTYARALAQLESCRPPHLSAAVAANGGSLPDRIARLLGQARPAVRSGPGPVVFAVVILFVVTALGMFGQANSRAVFQTVSIKQHDSGESSQGVGLGVNSSLLLMIQFAYAVHDSPHWLPLPASQVVGGPPWINSLRWDIDAKAPSNSDERRWLLMWQALLADRFRLRLHRETRELPTYELIAANTGPKLPAPVEAGCVSFPPGTPPRRVPGKVDCGYVGGPFFDAAGLRVQGSRVHMADLVRELALVLDRPISDKTGFTAEFDLDLSFASDGALLGFPGLRRPGDQAGTKPPSDHSSPNIFAALEEQLGLKLVPAKGPVEVLVIDHAEKPTEN